MIRSLIIDDEIHSCDALSILIRRYCPQVEVLSVCHSGKEGIEAILTHEPDLVFLDIEMPMMNGFEMLEQLPGFSFQLIFTTSYDRYAIRAIRFSALDYLLKPVDKTELQAAIKKVAQQKGKHLPGQLELLLEKMKHPSRQVRRIALPTMEGLQLVSVDEVISCTASSNYTLFSMKDGQRLMVSRTLKDTEELLEEYGFARVHHSHLVNLNEIIKYVKGEGGFLVMSDQSNVDVSRSRKEQLLQLLQRHRL